MGCAQGHRGRTFVILLPGEITASPDLLHPLIEDISLLHGAPARASCACHVHHDAQMHCLLRTLSGKPSSAFCHVQSSTYLQYTHVYASHCPCLCACYKRVSRSVNQMHSMLSVLGLLLRRATSNIAVQ